MKTSTWLKFSTLCLLSVPALFAQTVDVAVEKSTDGTSWSESAPALDTVSNPQYYRVKLTPQGGSPAYSTPVELTSNFGFNRSILTTSTGLSAFAPTQPGSFDTSVDPAFFQVKADNVGVILNEIRIDQGGSDDEEFIELRGVPQTPLSDLTVISIGDGAGGDGTIELVNPLSGNIPSDGLILIARSSTFDVTEFSVPVTLGDIDIEITGAPENSDNLTFLLVRDFTGSSGDDVDTNDDGVIDNPLWSEILDGVSIVETPTSGDAFYGVALGYDEIGPDGTFVPGIVYRGSDDLVWQIGDFADLSLFDTPGFPNPNSPSPSFPPLITSLSTIIADTGDFITVTGDNLASATAVTVGGAAATFFVDGANLEVEVPAGAVTGNLEVTNLDGSDASHNLIVIVPSFAIIDAEDFSGGIGIFTAEDVASNVSWGPGTFSDSFFMEMNGFSADVASEDWLISPELDLTSLANAFMYLGHERGFGGPALEILVSTNYAGTGDPNLATWVTLPLASPLAADSSNVVTDTGETSLNAYLGQTIHIGIKYTSTAPGAGNGARDRIHYFVFGGN